MGVVSQISDNVVVMKNGEIIEKGKIKSSRKTKSQVHSNILDCLFKLEDEKKKIKLVILQ